MTAMPPYPVLCTAAGCDQPACFKIAARWSDGQTAELKTYALSCSKCVSIQLNAAQLRQKGCRLAPGETMEAVGVYELRHGNRDRELVHRPDLGHRH